MTKKYQRRPSEVASAAWARGHMTPLELLRVAAWKTGQGLGSLTVNTEEEIKARTRAAIEAIGPWRGRQVSILTSDALWENWRKTAQRAIGAKVGKSGLLALEGVGYPMATAILDILDPGVWPVMDRWAVLTVFGPRPVGGPPPDWQHAAAYAAYTRHLVEQGTAAWGPGLSAHELDLKAMDLARTGGALPQGWSYARLPPRL